MAEFKRLYAWTDSKGVCVLSSATSGKMINAERGQRMSIVWNLDDPWIFYKVSRARIPFPPICALPFGKIFSYMGGSSVIFYPLSVYP